MSDVGKTRDIHRNELSKFAIGSGGNHFGRSISRIAVAQVCESIGFEGFNESALDSLADIAIRYLSDLGKTSKFYANLAGRTDCNVFDIIQAFKDLGMSQGFSGASELHTDSVVNSGPVREIIEYVELAEEIPFAQAIPQFPVFRERKGIPSFSQIGETPSSKHIPSWLPAFPDPHTYIRTPVWNERSSDARADKVELAKQRRKAENSLLSLQKRLVASGTLMAVPSAEPDDDDYWLEVNKIDRPVEEVEKRVSLVETFAPAVEAMKDRFDPGSDGEKILPNKRRSVLLEFMGGKKKVPCESLDLKLRNKAYGKKAPWFGREVEKDEKKRRVEYILRQPVDSQQELSQL